MTQPTPSFTTSRPYMSREVLLYRLFYQRPMASCAPSKSRTTFTWNWKVRLADMARTTMKSTSVLETTIKFDFLHRSVWLPPASSSADTTFEENIGQTFPTDLGDEGPFLGTIRAGRNKMVRARWCPWWHCRRVGFQDWTAQHSALRDHSLFSTCQKSSTTSPDFFEYLIAKMRLLEGYPTGSSGPFGSQGRVYGEPKTS